MTQDTSRSSTRRRSTLVVFNTVERLLRGDFFHPTEMEDVVAGLHAFPGAWSVVGLGTSNWYKRNGELLVAGNCGIPKFIWGDPTSEPQPGRRIDLSQELPEELAASVLTPEVGKVDSQPRFPFVCAAACSPEERLELEAPAGQPLHRWFEQEMNARNIGFSALQAEVKLSRAAYTTCCHIPLGGFKESEEVDIYAAFRQGELSREVWDLRGIYALNSTVQKIVSVEGHALHLHGQAPVREIAGHLTEAVPDSASRISIWPLRDLKLTIRDLDVAWMPVRRGIQEK